MNDALVAAVFRAALSLGIATPADLVPWADARVLARDQPAEWIIDLSIGAAMSVDQVSDAQREVAAPADRAIVFRLLTGLVILTDHLTFSEADRVSAYLERFGQTCDIGGEMGEVLRRMGMYFWLVRDGEQLIDPDALVADVVTFIGTHADPAARAWLPSVRITLSDV